MMYVIKSRHLAYNYRSIFLGYAYIVYSYTHNIYVAQTGSEVHPASYTMGTEGSFPGGKVSGA
jgi:hypothetical protein